MKIISHSSDKAKLVKMFNLLRCISSVHVLIKLSFFSLTGSNNDVVVSGGNNHCLLHIVLLVPGRTNGDFNIPQI